MRSILRAIEAWDSTAADLVETVCTVSVEDVAPDVEISAMCGRLRLGSQYDWLARFAVQQGLEHLELSVEKRDSRICGLLRGNMEVAEGRGGTTHRLVDDPDNPDLGLFRSFEFPILHLTKLDLLERAESAGWDNIMEKTWFCHSPKGGRPCGHCIPCGVAIDDGFKRRVPAPRRIRHYLRKIRSRVKPHLVSGSSS